MSGSNDFESINLGLSSHLARGTGVTLLNSIPDSTSGDEEEEEYDLDPKEFISPEREISNGGVPVESSSKLFPLSNSFDTIRTSDILRDSSSSSVFGGTPVNFPQEFPANIRTGDESPIEFLSNRIKLLTQELQDNSIKHETYVKSGNPNLDRVRSMIEQNYGQLSQSYYSLNELYSQDLTYTESLQSTFKKWDGKRNKILHRIGEIKSEKSKYGSKLINLVHKSQEIDDEVSKLEERLNELKIKKVIINKEIQDTNSVLESKTAKYVDMFKSMENDGKNAIVGFLQSNGLPETEIDSLVKSIPVDVGFKVDSKDITHTTSKSNPLGTFEEQAKTVPKLNGERAPKVNENKSIGMQAFEPPEIPQDLREMNYGHGPTAYEKGYAKGTENSKLVKTQLRKAIQVIFEQPKEKKNTTKKKGSIDEEFSNTITTKLMIEPILKFLEYKVDALSDLILSSAKKSSIFHEFGNIWQELIKVLTLSEGKLQNTLSESTKIEPVVPILTTSLQHSKTCLEKVQAINVDKNDMIQRKQLESIVLVEIHGLVEGLKLVGGDFKEYEKLDQGDISKVKYS
ncbi:hypothetical protein JA1_003628 [Spathaspora sp. JA1]|nr:hypothetical protein JA1_003628 [Spathaspora sp. JA1]